MTWQIDSGHSIVQFTARHMMLTKVRGEFAQFSGELDLNEAEPTRSTVNVSIDVASLSTRDEKRDGHLKSPDFFNVEAFPHMTFVSTSVEQTGGDTGKLHGHLTIKDITKPVALDVEYLGQQKSPWGTTSAGFVASTRINRKEWGLTWNVALESGGVLVGEDIDIRIEIEAVKA